MFLDSFKKATHMVVAFLVFVTALRVFAEEPKLKENFKDIVAKAQNLLVQRERAQAAKVLVAATFREAKGSAAHKELSRNLTLASEVFFSEKGQELYEAALSAKREAKQDISLEKLEQARRLEKDNVLILQEAAKIHLLNKDCAKAEEALLVAEKLNPLSEEVRLYMELTAVCHGDIARLKQVRLKRETVTFSDPFLEGVSMLYELQMTSQGAKVVDKAQELAKMFTKYPETQYYLWKEASANNKLAQRFGEKYITLCRAQEVKLDKQFNKDPWLCSREKEVSTYLEKLR